MANNLKDLRTLTDFIRNFFSKAVLTISGKVSVDNLPEVQKVEVLNPTEAQSSVEISNLSGLQKAIETLSTDVVKSIKAQSNDIKPEKVKKDLISALSAIEREISVKPEDRTHLVTDKLDEVVKSVQSIDTTVDLDPIVKSIEELKAIVNIIESVKKGDRLKVVLSDKQIEQLSRGQSVAVQGGGISSGAVTVKRVDDGGSDASDLKADKLYTAEYSTEVGLKVHVVGDGDKFVVSNATEGGAIATNDGIPLAGENAAGNKVNLRCDDDGFLLTKAG